MSKDKPYEMPFEYLTRKENGLKFEGDIVKNWYLARRFVLDKFREEKVGFEPKSCEHLHVIVNGDSPIMLSVVRQVALTAHFINYQEGSKTGSPCNTTVITLVSKNPHIITELEKEEYLCNLPKYCKIINHGKEIENEGYFIDIELHIVDNSPDRSEGEKLMCFSEQDVDEFCKGKSEQELYCIDTSKSVYASRIYNLGVAFDNIPAEDIHCTERYTLALDVFQHEKLKNDAENMITEKWGNLSLSKIKESISNIFCSDSFTIREECVIKAYGIKNYTRTCNLWGKYNEPLSISEHARWVVEKLIMGYRALNAEERYHDENLSVQCKNKDKKKKYRDSLKRTDKDPAHIDLCSYRDLRRINPEDLKYDSFLMLAIPAILKRCE